MQLQDISINRKKELEIIPKGLNMGQSYVIIAPRRYGKTILIRKIIQHFDHKNTIYIDQNLQLFYSFNPMHKNITIFDSSPKPLNPNIISPSPFAIHRNGSYVPLAY